MTDTLYGVPDFHGDREQPEDWTAADVAKHRTQRAEDGFSVFDWWAFDQYIAEVVARAALKFAHEGSGYFEEMGEEGTREYFIGIARPLMEYAQDKFKRDVETQLRVREEAKDAMMRFAEHFPRWWD